MWWEYVKFWTMVLGFGCVGFTLFIALWVIVQSYLGWRRDRAIEKVIQKGLDKQFGEE